MKTTQMEALGENTNYTEIRKRLLKVFIGFLSLTAAVAILSVLSRKFGETQIKVLATTCSITAGSICAMSCAAFLERKGAKWVGLAGILAASLSVLLVIGGVWAQIKGIDQWIITAYWKTTATVSVAAVAFAVGCVLRLPNLAASYRWIQTASTVLIALLAVQITVALCGEINQERYFRIMAALAVLVVLVSLIIPICSRLGTSAGKPAEGRGQTRERLVLEKLSAGVFEDDAGRRYQVTEINAEPGGLPPAGAANAPPASMG
jgi:hypothetical protein